MPRLDAVLERLRVLHPKAIDLSLGRMERLLAALGHPEARLPPVIHVAGTNGKGSLVAFLRAMVEAAGRKAHVYTSPHLVRFNERIRVAGTLIDDDALADLVEECERANGAETIPQFEITTAAAFLAYARTPADVLLLEVGLGGRYDATNVIPRPLLTAITPVSLDHQHYLGTTVAAIAGEKAGILKPGVTAVIGPQSAEALAVIAARARALRAPLSLHGRDWSVEAEGAGMRYASAKGERHLPKPGLAGRHQIPNAATAIACLEAQDAFAIPEAAIREGLARVEWPARLQRLTRGPLMAALPKGAELWLDGGHNPGAGEVIAATLRDWGAADGKPLHLVIGMLENKDDASFLAPFLGLARSVAAVAIPGEHCHPPQEIAAHADSIGLSAGVAPDLVAAIAEAPAGARILICGSLYLAGQVLATNS
ncbi:MAG: bifunctional folylpolyglutamate synthase/dihydrofolate synthase [Alphaproteobacteria bacterium]|nr:bifunctional folylpolyglutamate synthase/dihydrofolate synthase [Alphaproteobacteria bacterium]